MSHFYGSLLCYSILFYDLNFRPYVRLSVKRVTKQTNLCPHSYTT